jgi:hypothetical protein
MLGSLKAYARRREPFDRAAAAVRTRFGLGADDVVVVTEAACGLPGCPPLEMVIQFWTADGTRHRLKLFKQVAEFQPADLPPAWLRPALVAPEGQDDSCC